MTRSTKVWADFTDGYSPVEPINWWATGLATLAAAVLSLLALAVPHCSGHSQMTDAIMKMSLAFAGSGITVSVLSFLGWDRTDGPHTHHNASMTGENMHAAGLWLRAALPGISSLGSADARPMNGASSSH